MVSSAQLQYTSDDASRSRLTRATELCGVYSATIEEALVRIHQVDQALLPLATQIEQISEASGTGAPPDALGPPGFQEIVGTEGSTPGAASASRAGPAPTATSFEPWPFQCEPLRSRCFTPTPQSAMPVRQIL